ncbi:MAG: hypothetical protein K2V38_00280 [Gemmataceae bacterium]|nr:hypothetical protein [Gemmataceae bacterium]
MDIRYSEAVRQWPEGFELLQQATRRLEEVVGPADAPNLSGEWDRTGAPGEQSQFTLRVRNPDGEVRGELDLLELQNPHFRSIRMRDVWGQLLNLRIHRLLANLQEGDE